jgi:hypothetical protein
MGEIFKRHSLSKAPLSHFINTFLLFESSLDKQPHLVFQVVVAVVALKPPKGADTATKASSNRS